jgi:spermidine/putrescine transport system substrate-binding protein
MARRRWILFLLLLSALGAFLALHACTRKPSSLPVPPKSNVVLYNWKEYTELSVLRDFEKESGMNVILYEYETMPMMIAEVQSNPGKYDVIIMDGNIVPVMKDLKLIEELNLAMIPNYGNIREEHRRKPMYDHQGTYSLPYLWGTTGLVYNTKYVHEKVDSWKILWDRKYRGRIALMNDPREGMTVLLKSLGYSLNTSNPLELKAAELKAAKLKENGVRFGDTLGNIQKVMSGELWIAEVYNGDVFYKVGDRKDVKFANPREGFNLWSEYLCLSYDSTNKEGAYRLMNYFLRPAMSARATNKFCNPSFIEGDEKFIKKELLENPIIFPPRDLVEVGEMYIELGETNKEYERIFNSMK